jgi:glycerol-3-phosphate acyltransferase PlsX
MGGDHAPREIVRGAIQAVRELDIELTLVGARDKIERELETDNAHIPIVDTPDMIAFTEQPAFALKAKPRASIALINQIVHDGQADAAVTMGHTGAGMIAAMRTFGNIEGVHRPAIAVPFFQMHPDTVFLDAGLNVDCKPENLAEFAVMGSVYAERVLGIPSPTIALMTNGREDNKGNALTHEAFALIKASGLAGRFIGNVEGYDLPRGTANVIVCDGMWGNMLLKLSETLSEELLSRLESRIADVESRGVVTEWKHKMDYAEIGAMPLLGVNGLILIGHGRSRAPAVVGALRQAVKCVRGGLVEATREGIKQGLIVEARN